VDSSNKTNELIKEVIYGRSKKYEYQFDAPELNTKAFEELRELKLNELQSILEYVNLNTSRMKFLCEYLGDDIPEQTENCDNTNRQKFISNPQPETVNMLSDFRETYFPELKVESQGSNIVNGIAASYYGVSNVGAAIRRSKYQNGGDFPDFLLKLTLKAFRKLYGQEPYDLIVYVPPTESGDLVKNFAEKISMVLKIPISHNLLKAGKTQPQKVFENGYLKRDNVSGMFKFDSPNEISGKAVVLIDDIFDSGATIKEIGRMLTNNGASKIAPLVIARTVGGDI